MLGVADAGGAWAQTSVRPPEVAAPVVLPKPRGLADFGRDFGNRIGGENSAQSSSVRPPEGAVLPARPASQAGPSNALGRRSLSARWHDLRLGARGVASSDTASNQPIQTLGQDWRLLRRNYLLRYLGWIPLGVLGLLAVVYIVRGPMPLNHPKTGRKLPRFAIDQRVAHWFTAGVFLFLGLSGLTIFFGRALLEPLFGKAANSALVSAALQGHNLFGPLFIVGLLWMFIRFVRHNFFQWSDILWIVKLGGFFGGHVSSHKFNFGEKAWFWLLMLAGGLMALTGIVLLFPWLASDLWQLQLATVLHVLGAITLISVALGHIYIGSIGMEGAIDSMLVGEVEEAWAIEHHDLWHAEVSAQTPPQGIAGSKEAGA